MAFVNKIQGVILMWNNLLIKQVLLLIVEKYNKICMANVLFIVNCLFFHCDDIDFFHDMHALQMFQISVSY